MTLYKTVHSKFASHQLKRSLLRRSELATRRTSSRVRNSNNSVLLLAAPHVAPCSTDNMNTPRAGAGSRCMTTKGFHSIGSFGDYSAHNKEKQHPGKGFNLSPNGVTHIIGLALHAKTFHLLVAVFVVFPLSVVLLWRSRYSSVDCCSSFWMLWTCDTKSRNGSHVTTFDQRALWCAEEAVLLAAIVYFLLLPLLTFSVRICLRKPTIAK